MIAPKIETMLFSALLLAGTGLWQRILVQGFEPALVSTAMDWILTASKRVRERL
jgi:hypothetical protein